MRTSGDETQRYVEPYHDRVRETVTAALSEEEQREHHRQLAMVLESSFGGDPQLPAAHLFNHFHAAGDRSKAAQYVLPAADQAAADLAFEQAARLYRQALELGAVAPDQAHVVRKRLADALADAGHGVEAAAEYQVAALGFSGTAAVDLRRRAAEYLLRAGRLDEGWEVVRGVAAAVGLWTPRCGLEARLMTLWDVLRLRLRGTHYRERGEHEIALEDLLRIDTCYSVGVVVNMNALLGLPFVTRFLLLALEAGEANRVSRALVCLAVVRAWSHRRQDVADIFRRAESAARRAENAGALGYLRMNMGFIYGMRGQWRAALDHSDDALSILSQVTDAIQLDRSSTHIAVLASLFFLGEIRELARRMPRMLEEARRREDAFSASVPHTYFGNVAWLAADDVERARRGAQEVLSRFPPERFLHQHVFELIGSLQIDLYLGEGSRAWKRLAEAWPKYRKSFYASNLLYRPVLHHLRARAALASIGPEQNNRALVRSALRDAKRLDRERAAWCDSLAGLVRAGVAAVQGDGETAAALLRRAIPQFELAEMALFAAVARWRLGELLGGEEGCRLVRVADEWMQSEGIRVPWRFAAMLAPGFGRSWLG